ncbi:DUF3800 domain-containing protein [Promicromonospora sp. CA-289599]|uniref:DUF3800 domain-containing protein n=1 Tax=Promicromonospora sp. CA-289599 TaxID=3240014 RepID=UPI003D8E0BB4
MAQLVYIDETGSVGNAAKRQPYLTLVAAIVDETAVKPLTDHLSALAMKHLGWIPADFEWHGAELWSGRGHWASKRLEHEARLAAFEDVIGLLPTVRIGVAFASIDKRRLHDKYEGRYDRNAYLLALQFMLEKLDIWRPTPEVLRVLIADEAKQEQLKAIEMVADMQRWGFSGVVPGRQLTSIIDSMHFVDSRHSPGVPTWLTVLRSW